MLFNYFIITSLIFSFAFRTPIIYNVPYDYEFRIGNTIELKENKNNFQFYIIFLYEREIGLYGTGHELEIKFEKKDKVIETIFNKDVRYYRQLTSYLREIKDINWQTIDTGYFVINELALGYTIFFKEFNQTALLYYLHAQIKHFTLNVSISPIKDIMNLKGTYEIILNKNISLSHLLIYKEYDFKKDYSYKLIINYNFNINK